jgi:hypothetical protein
MELGQFVADYDIRRDENGVAVSFGVPLEGFFGLVGLFSWDYRRPAISLDLSLIFTDNQPARQADRTISPVPVFT